MKYVRVIKFICLVTCGLFWSTQGHATDAISCSGTISTIGVHGTDRVMLKLSGMNAIVKICDLSQTIGSTFPISPEQCKLAYSTLLTAYATGKSINVYFDNVQNGTNCNNFSPWEVATARWVHLDN